MKYNILIKIIIAIVLMGILISIIPLSTAVVDTIASDTLQYSSDAEVTSSATNFALVKSITMTNSYTGSWRIKFDIRDAADGGTPGTTIAKIYKNSIAYGTQRATNSVSYVTYSEDFTSISITSGDTIEIWIYTTSILPVGVAGTQNFRIYFDTPTTDLLSSSVNPTKIFKCQLATISASFNDFGGITAVYANLVSEKAVQPMVPGSGRTRPETQSTNITMSYNGSYWVGTFGNDNTLLWGNRHITYNVIYGTIFEISSPSSIFVHSDKCTGTGVTSYQNLTHGIGTYTNMIANTDIDIISWALYPWVQYWGYLFYVLILFTICSVVYLKTENVTQVLLIGLALLLLGSTTIFIPPEWQNWVIMLIGLAMAGVYYKIFTRE